MFAMLMLTPGMASASDFRGFLSGAIIFTLGSVSALIGLVLLVFNSMDGAYRDKRTARRHALFASIVPVLGFLAMLVEGGSVPADGIVERLAFNSAAIGLALLPLVIHRVRYRTQPEDGKHP